MRRWVVSLLLLALVLGFWAVVAFFLLEVEVEVVLGVVVVVVVVRRRFRSGDVGIVVRMRGREWPVAERVEAMFAGLISSAFLLSSLSLSRFCFRVPPVGFCGGRLRGVQFRGIGFYNITRFLPFSFSFLRSLFWPRSCFFLPFLFAFLFSLGWDVHGSFCELDNSISKSYEYLR